MKKIILPAIILLILGCETFNVIYPPTPNSICDEEYYSGCLLCRIAEDRGVQLEQVHDLILNIEMISVAVAPESYDEIASFNYYLRQFVSSNPTFLLSDLFDWTKEQQVRYAAVAKILSSRIQWLNVNLPVDPPSRDLIIIHSNQVTEEIGRLLLLEEQDA